MRALRSDDRHRRADVRATPLDATVLTTVAATIAAGVGVLCGLLGIVGVIVAGVALIVAAGVFRHTLTDTVAGLTLLLARPYATGERIRVYAPGLRDVVEAEILRVGLTRTWLCTGQGMVVVGNRTLLRAAPTPAAAPSPENDRDPA